MFHEIKIVLNRIRSNEGPIHVENGGDSGHSRVSFSRGSEDPTEKAWNEAEIDEEMFPS